MCDGITVVLVRERLAERGYERTCEEVALLVEDLIERGEATRDITGALHASWCAEGDAR